MNKIFTQKKHVEVNVKNADADDYRSSDFNFVPSQSVIQNILNYSKALAVKKTESLGYLDVVLN